MKTQLLLTFTTRKFLDKSINYIMDCYEFSDDRIFILSNKDYKDDLFLTYNVIQKKYPKIPNRTMAVHRKRETNTLYTINAINKVVEEELGYRNSNWEINWKEYKNSLLLTEYTDEYYDLVHIRTKLEDIYTFS